MNGSNEDIGLSYLRRCRSPRNPLNSNDFVARGPDGTDGQQETPDGTPRHRQCDEVHTTTEVADPGTGPVKDEHDELHQPYHDRFVRAPQQESRTMHLPSDLVMCDR